VVNPLVGGSRVVLWKGCGRGPDRCTANGVAARARNLGSLLRLMQSGQHTQLRHVGAVRVGASHCGHGDRGRPPMNLPTLILALPWWDSWSRCWCHVLRRGAADLGLAISLATFAASLACPRCSTARPGPATHPKRAVDRHARYHYHVAVDGVSLWLVLLSTFLTPICVLVSWRSIQNRVRSFSRFCCCSNSAGGRVPGAGPVPVLRLLGSFLGAHVLPDGIWATSAASTRR